MPTTAHFAALPLAAPIATGLQASSAFALLYLSFPSLLEDPSSSLLRTLPILSIIQTAYLLTLPRPHATTKKGRAPSSSTRIKSSLKSLILSYILAITLGTLVLFLTTILLGAPITTHQSQTLLFSTHCAVLAVYPLVFELGVDGAQWKRVFEVRVVGNGREFAGAVGTVVGAWLGAVVIPLDWDRIWQRWPVPILVGAYIGSVVGRAVGLTGVVSVGKSKGE